MDNKNIPAEVRSEKPALPDKGRIELWLGDAFFAPAQPPKKGRLGRPHQYSDQVIEMLLDIKHLYGLPLRSLEGFALSLKQIFAHLPTPNYTTLSRRAKALELSPAIERPTQALYLLLTSSGTHVWDGGGWQGAAGGERNTGPWQKVLICADAHSGKITATKMPRQDAAQDPRVMPAAPATPAASGDRPRSTPMEVLC